MENLYNCRQVGTNEGSPHRYMASRCDHGVASTLPEEAPSKVPAEPSYRVHGRSRETNSRAGGRRDEASTRAGGSQLRVVRSAAWAARGATSRCTEERRRHADRASSSDLPPHHSCLCCEPRAGYFLRNDGSAAGTRRCASLFAMDCQQTTWFSSANAATKRMLNQTRIFKAGS
jgi:hypothetical protein